MASSSGEHWLSSGECVGLNNHRISNTTSRKKIVILIECVARDWCRKS